MTQLSRASQHALVEHDPLDWPSGWHRSALWYTPTALQYGLLRVDLGLCDGGMLTLPYSLEASRIPDAHRTSAFGLSHSGAQRGSAAHPTWNPNVPRPGADQRPRWRARHAAAPGHGRSWVSALALRLPWDGLRRCGDVPGGDHLSSRVPGGGPVAIPRPIILRSPGDPPRSTPATDSYAKKPLWRSAAGKRVCQGFLLDRTADS